MAKTFTLDSSSGYGTYQGRFMRLSCTQTPDTSTNKSTINWTLSSIGGTSNYYSTGPTTVIINGVQVYYKARAEWDTYAFPAAKGSVSGSFVIDHNADGSKSINVSMTTSVWYGQASSYTGTWTLDNIPRQAKITSASDFTDVGNPSIFFSNPGGFTMDVWLEPNANGDQLCIRRGIPNTDRYTWELTDAEREELRSRCDKNTCKIRLGLYSYVGGVAYADFRDVTYTMTENDATKPSVEIKEILLDNGQLPSKFNGWPIQGKSRFTITLSATGKYNAEIKSYSATVDGKTYNDSTFTTDVIKNTKIDIAASAKDSREFTGTATAGLTAIAYSKPLVIPLEGENAILCYRSDTNGNRTGRSKTVWVKAKRSYYTVDGMNTCALQCRRKLVTEEWDEDKHPWLTLIGNTETTGEYNALFPWSTWEFDEKKAYTVQIRAIDDIGERDIKTFEIPTEDVALHLGKGGKNVSIGTYCDYSEEHTFYSEWKAIFGGGVCIGDKNTTLKDYIISVINGGG